MNRKWLYGAAIVAVIALTSVSVSRTVSDRASNTEVSSIDLEVDKDTRVKTSKISEQELQTITLYDPGAIAEDQNNGSFANTSIRNQ
jgi:hypothetical protein